MPVRETDLGHVYVEASIRPLSGSRKKWTGRLLVDTGATDTFVPAGVLKKLGIKPAGRRAYELADGTWQELDIAFGVIEVMGQSAGGTLVFAGDKEEPLLGVTVLESTGFCVDPRREQLIPHPPKRKRRVSSTEGLRSRLSMARPPFGEQPFVIECGDLECPTVLHDHVPTAPHITSIPAAFR